MKRQPGITPEELNDKLNVLPQALHQVVPDLYEPEALNREQGEQVQVLTAV